MEVKLKLTSEEHKDLVAYCNLNERYGLLNTGGEIQEKIVEKEVIRYVEIPVVQEKEVIKIEYVEIEKPIEVIVEKIVEIEKPIEVIKEVIVEKIIHDNSKTDEEVKIFSTKMVEIENIFQNEKNELLLKIQQLEERKPEVIEKVVGDDTKQKLLEQTLQKLRSDLIEKDKKIKEFEETIQSFEILNGVHAKFVITRVRYKELILDIILNVSAIHLSTFR